MEPSQSVGNTFFFFRAVRVSHRGCEIAGASLLSKYQLRLALEELKKDERVSSFRFVQTDDLERRVPVRAT